MSEPLFICDWPYPDPLLNAACPPLPGAPCPVIQWSPPIGPFPPTNPLDTYCLTQDPGLDYYYMVPEDCPTCVVPEPSGGTMVALMIMIAAMLTSCGLRFHRWRKFR